MKKIAVIASIIVFISSIIIMEGCKTSKELIELFSVATTSGYSKKVTTLDPDDTGLTSINLFLAIRNHGDISGNITHWVFKIRHNIVTLVEINSNNYQDYNLTITGDTTVPPDEINELYVGTPQPFLENALGKDKLSFDPYIPTEVIVEVQVTDDNGETHSITGKGSYTYEQGTRNESKYDIVGSWEFERTIDGQKRAKQKIVFVGTKTHGQFATYNLANNEVESTGTYTVSNYKYISFTSNDGTKYWGEFNDESNISGTLIIPENPRENQENQTGTWKGKKI